MQSNSTYRVVQWSTGTIGVRALRAIVEHPDLALAGVYVHGEDKAGRDAGELCSLRPVGVTATTNVDDVIASDADCVVYMPNAPDVDTLVALLAAGLNVVTTCGLFHHPRQWIRLSGNAFRMPVTPAEHPSTAREAAQVSSPRPCRWS